MSIHQGRKVAHNRKPIPVGTRFERLTTIGEIEYDITNGRSYVMCHCDCGTVCRVERYAITKSHTMSCGCLSRELLAAGGNNRSHGMSKRSEYRIWSGMIMRCHAEGSEGYMKYGARGIRVCQRWRESFESFYADMGPRPSKAHTIEREDNGGNYEPGNCIWATIDVQNRNRRSTRFITIDGEVLCATDWANRFGIKPATILYRLNAGWAPEAAVSTPVQVHRKLN